jgi:uncharacterized membrane protein YkoI
MSVAKRFWHVIAVVAIAAGFSLVSPVSAQDRDEQKGQQSTGKSKAKGKAPDIVEIDLNKLPPDLAKEIRDRLKKKSGPTISLIDAIKIVEATGKGEVERAARRLSKGETQFYVEINTGERHRTRITLNAQGKILSSKKAD